MCVDYIQQYYPEIKSSNKTQQQVTVNPYDNSKYTIQQSKQSFLHDNNNILIVILSPSIITEMDQQVMLSIPGLQSHPCCDN